MTAAFHRSRSGLVGIVAALLCACGGGGGGGSSGGGGGVPPADAPAIFANLISLPPNGSITKPDSVTTNSAAIVQVYNNTTGASITTATVTMNGTSLPYLASADDYEGQITVNPGASVTLRVQVNGHTYSATERQVSAFPTILTPTSGATWTDTEDNLVSWSATAPSLTAYYISGVFDQAGNLLWPGGNLQRIEPSTHSYTIPAYSLSDGNRLVLVGILDVHPISGAAEGSEIAVGGFDLVPIVVQQNMVWLNSISVTPNSISIAPDSTVQLTATGLNNNGTMQDLTASADWTSSDPSIVSVSSTGLATGHAKGVAQVTATRFDVAGHATVGVFLPDPSPSPPLSQAVAWQIDYGHTGHVTVGPGGPVFPPSGSWSVSLNGLVSYPLIADGKVFVITSVNASDPSNGGTSLYALEEASGSIAWGPVSFPSNSHWAGHAFDHHRVFVINNDGRVSAFEAATGAVAWTAGPITDYADAAPTAVNGVLNISSNNSLQTLDEASGTRLWGIGVNGGMRSSPAVGDGGVFVSYPGQVYKIDPYTGTSLWHFDNGGSGGGGATGALAGGRFYTYDWADSEHHNKLFEAATGNLLGYFEADIIPTLSDRTAFFLKADANARGVLTAKELSTDTTRWTFTGDDHLASPSLVIDDVLVVVSTAGMVYALNADSGAVIWSTSAGGPIQPPDDFSTWNPLMGIGAGDGWLVVPAGDTVNAWKLVP